MTCSIILARANYFKVLVSVFLQRKKMNKKRNRIFAAKYRRKVSKAISWY